MPPCLKARQYLVIKRRGKWCTKSLGRFGLPHASEAKALSGAIDSAVECSRKGGQAMVALFVKDRRPKVVWASDDSAVWREPFRDSGYTA